jgi:hypothetical protein
MASEPLRADDVIELYRGYLRIVEQTSALRKVLQGWVDLQDRADYLNWSEMASPGEFEDAVEARDRTVVEIESHLISLFDQLRSDKRTDELAYRFIDSSVYGPLETLSFTVEYLTKETGFERFTDWREAHRRINDLHTALRKGLERLEAVSAVNEYATDAAARRLRLRVIPGINGKRSPDDQSEVLRLDETSALSADTGPVFAFQESEAAVANDKIERVTVAQRPSLNKNQEKALNYIKANPGSKAIVISRNVGIAESTFLTHYVPKLKQHGVCNEGDGYVWRPFEPA